MSNVVDEMLAFLAEATTPFHAVSGLAWRLAAAGFTEICSAREVGPEPGRGYFLTRNDSSIIAFRSGRRPLSSGARLVGAHTDSPNLSVKPNPLKVRNGVAQLGVDVYGGALLNPWFDRDLSLAGRVSFVTADGALCSQLIDFRRPIACIPSLAIHLDREANNQRSINPQKDILPIVMVAEEGSALDFKALLAQQLRAEYPEYEDIRVLDYEMSLYDTQPPARIGLDKGFVASARLDNLLSCHVGMTALRDAGSDSWSFLVCTDHEEVGSASAVGAQGPMLMETLAGLCPDSGELEALRRNSWMFSVDNAHAVHPNFSDRHDDNHGPELNGGPVIKINRNQRYATSGEGAALVRWLAERHELPVQTFVVRSDLGCGSTIGPITATETGIATVDIGVPTLAMHSVRELAGVADIDTLLRLLVAFYRYAP